MKPKTSTRPGALPTPAQAAELRQRLHRLAPAQAEMMRQVMRLHAAGDKLMATQWLLQVAREAPDHPEVRLWQGLRHLEAQEWAQATAHLAQAAALRPGFEVWLMLATAQGHLDEGTNQSHAQGSAAVLHSLQQAEAHAATAGEWLRLSIAYDSHSLYEHALRAANRLLALAPKSAPGLLQRSRCSKALGLADAAAADCRALIAADAESPRAWFALVDLKTVALTAAEVEQLKTTATRPGWKLAEQQFLDFALGKALEDAGDAAQALAVLQRANRSVRAVQPWDSAGFARHVAALEATLASGLPAQALPQGRQVIFLVGMPRSGSTLVEQVLAAHSMVEGASELPYLNQVLQAESQRRGQPLLVWAGKASAEDWTRLGQDYLRDSARWRQNRPIATDKLPDNWLLAGAALAMLPEARVIDCRRDALETCWSCYKQLFAPGLANFSYDFDSLAQYLRAVESVGDVLAQRHPQRFRIQSYEALVAQPEAQIRELLAFCDLPFEAGCLTFQSAQRAIRTPSALQVRQPMTRASTPGARFGALLDPLRDALGAAQSSQ